MRVIKNVQENIVVFNLLAGTLDNCQVTVLFRSQPEVAQYSSCDLIFMDKGCLIHRLQWYLT